MADGAAASVDRTEVRRFADLATQWWDEDGPMAPLHRMNPTRAGWLIDRACRHFGRDPTVERPLSGLSALDVGCGGGLLAESLAQAGAVVTGIDPAEENVQVADRHARAMELEITYRAEAVEAVVARGARFDIVAALEVVEHVADVRGFIEACSAATAPGGVLVLSTLNRTLRSWGVAILGAEYVLRWLPQGTHDWRKFPKPAELAKTLRAAGLRPAAATGMAFEPRTGGFKTVPDLGINYMMMGAKGGD